MESSFCLVYKYFPLLPAVKTYVWNGIFSKLKMFDFLLLRNPANLGMLNLFKPILAPE